LYEQTAVNVNESNKERKILSVKQLIKDSLI